MTNILTIDVESTIYKYPDEGVVVIDVEVYIHSITNLFQYVINGMMKQALLHLCIKKK